MESLGILNSTVLAFSCDFIPSRSSEKESLFFSISLFLTVFDSVEIGMLLSSSVICKLSLVLKSVAVSILFLGLLFNSSFFLLTKSASLLYGVKYIRL